MTSDQTSSNPTNANAAKDPSEWVTGEEFDSSLSKAAASQKIDELQQKTGRGQGSTSS